VLATVADAEDRKDATWSGDWVGAELFVRGKSPIKGASFLLIP
jgi:hypothetical protein